MQKTILQKTVLKVGNKGLYDTTALPHKTSRAVLSTQVVLSKIELGSICIFLVTLYAEEQT